MSVSTSHNAAAASANGSGMPLRVPQPLALPLAQRTRTPQASPRLQSQPQTANGSHSAAAAAVSPRASNSSRRPILADDDSFDLGPASGSSSAAVAAGPASPTIAVIPPSSPVTPTSSSAASSAASLLAVHRPTPLMNLEDTAPLSGIGVPLSSPPRARLAAAAIGSPSASASAASSYPSLAASPFVGSLRSSMMSRLSELEESADTHSTPEPGSGLPLGARPSLLHSPSSAGGSRSTWPAPGSMIRSNSSVSSSIAAAGAGSAASPKAFKERSRSAMLEQGQIDAVRSALGFAFTPLMDAGGSSELEALAALSPLSAASPPVAAAAPPPPPFDFSDLRAFVQTPLPRGVQLCCTMYRERSGSSFSSRRFYPTYTICAEDASLPPSQLELDALCLPPPATAASVSARSAAAASASAVAAAAVPPRRLRVLMYATKKSSSRYHFRLADSGDLPPEEAACFAANLAAAACSTPTLSPLLVGGVGLPPQHSPRAPSSSSQAASADSDPSASPSSKDAAAAASDPNFLGCLLSNFIGNKYAFSAHTAAGLGAGNQKEKERKPPALPRTPSASASSSSSARRAASPLQFHQPSHVVATLDGASLSSFSSLAGPGGVLSPSSSSAAAASVSASSHGLTTSGDVEIEYEINIFSRAPRHMSVLLPPLRAASVTVADLLASSNPNAAAMAAAAEAAGGDVAASSLSVGAGSSNPLRRLSSASTSAAASAASRPRKSSSVSAPCSTALPLRLQSNAPRWNALRGCHTLNFQGRAPVPSLKNFQLVRVDSRDAEATAAAAAAGARAGSVDLTQQAQQQQPKTPKSPAAASPPNARMHPLTVQQQSPSASPRNAPGSPLPPQSPMADLPPAASPISAASVSASVDSTRVVLQLGKAGPNAFHVDLRYPLTPLQAFAIVLSAFDYKIAVD